MKNNKNSKKKLDQYNNLKFIDWKKMEMPPMMWIGNMCLSHTNHELFWNQKNLLNRLSN